MGRRQRGSRAGTEIDDLLRGPLEALSVDELWASLRQGFDVRDPAEAVVAHQMSPRLQRQLAAAASPVAPVRASFHPLFISAALTDLAASSFRSPNRGYS